MVFALLIPTESVRSDVNPDRYFGPSGTPIALTVTTAGKLEVPSDLPFDMAAVLKERSGGSRYGIRLKAQPEASMKSVSFIADALVDSHFVVHIDLPTE